MNALADWAQAWRIPAAALADLTARMARVDGPQTTALDGASEAAVQARTRLRASKLGMALWRNNVGATELPDGSWLRYGLANDSAAVNRVVKSGDLIGIRPRVILPADVGRRIGQFVSVECKSGAWRGPRPGNAREQAQLAWAARVQALGGDAMIVNSEESL